MMVLWGSALLSAAENHISYVAAMSPLTTDLARSLHPTVGWCFSDRSSSADIQLFE